MTYDDTNQTFTMGLSESRQAAQDSIHDLVRDSMRTIHNIRYAVISPLEKDKLVKEVHDNLMNIDTLRRSC